MAGKSYSAGRIFLQVVPSFKNLQRDIGREVRKANDPLEKQQEEIGKKHEEARERGAQKVRARVADRAVRAEEDIQEARLRQFQRFSQMYLGEVAKEGKRREAIENKNAERLGKREMQIAQDRIKGMRRADELVSKMRAKSIKDEQERQRRNMQYQGELQRLLAAGDIRRAKEVAKERTRIEADAQKERLRLANEEAAAEARIEARNEARRKIIRQRRINQRLADLRAEESARRRLAGGEVGSRIQRGVKGAADAIGVVRITADSSPARAEIAALRERLLALSKQEIGIDLDAGEAMAEIEAIQARLAVLAQDKDAEIDVEVNATAALIALKRIEQQVDQINRKRLGGGLSGWFAGMRSSAEDGANSFRIFNPRVLALVTLLPTLAPLLASAAAGIGALSTAAVGGALGLGVLIVGLTGIFEAVTALGDVQDNAAKDALATSKAMRNAARGVRDAEQGVTRAREQAARGAEDAARRVSDARRGLADTERTVARQIRDALDAQQEAEEDLARAQRDATDAQRDLMEARARAQRDQDELADRIKSGQLDERQGLIDLFNAQVAYNAAMADGGATNLEREEAAIQLERAQLAMKGIRRENKELQEQQKKGIAGDENYIAAQERAAAAIEGQKDAQERLRDAEANVREVRLEGAQQIADAQRSVADAIHDQSEQAADSARAIRDAQERLTDSQEAYQEALTQTGDIGSASMQKLEQAMGKLSPAGRRFALFLFGLRDGFYQLRAIIQEGMLPGIQTAMEGLIKRYGPSFMRFVGVMAETIGRFAITFGEALQSPGMVRFFETMEEFAPIFLTQWGDLAIAFTRIIAGLMTAFAPFAKEFMDSFVEMAEGWAVWAEGLAGSEGFNNFLDYVRVEGPKVLELIKNIFLTLLNVGIGLSQTGVFDALTGFFEFLANMNPAILAGIVQGILGLMIASQVSAGINSLIISLMLLTGTTVGLVVLGIAALVVAFVYLWNNVEGFRDFFIAAWEWIKDAAAATVNWFQTSLVPWFRDSFLPAMQTVWDGIVLGVTTLWDAVRPTMIFFGQLFAAAFQVIKWAWDNILFPVLEFLGNTILWLWNTVIQPTLRIIWELFVYLFRIVAAAWNNIGLPILRAWATVMFWLWDTVIKPVLGWIGAAWSWLWDGILQPIFKVILDGVTGLFNGIVWVWDNILAPMFEAIASLLEGDFVKAWESAVKAVGGIWKGLQKLIAMPINFVIETVLNNGLFKAFNKVMEFFGLDTRAPHLQPVRWGEDTGDTWTGKTNTHGRFAQGGVYGVLPGYSPGRDIHTFYSPTGGRLDLSGGEAVMRPEFTRAVGGEEGIAYLNALARRGQLPWQRYAIGGMIKPVNARPGFPWGRYPSGKVHKALDLPVPIGTPVVAPWPGKVLRDGWDSTGYGTHLRLQNYGGGTGTGTVLGHLSREIVNVGQMVRAGQTIAYSGNTGRSTGPHLHLAVVLDPFNAAATGIDFTNAFNGGRSVTPAAGVKGVDLPWWADKPLDFLEGIVSAATNLIPVGGVWGEMIKATPHKIFDGLRSFVAGLLGGNEVGTDDVQGGGGSFFYNGMAVPNNGTMMFDNGGYVQPGVTQVLNMTGRPEPVFTDDQWARGGGDGAAPLVGTYAPTFYDSNVDAEDVMEEFSYTLARVSHGGKFAGRSH